MRIEYILIILMWVIGLASFIKFTPKNRKRKILFAIMVSQSITWLSTLLQVKYSLLSFPVRELPKATDLLVTTEYFFYPLICGFYIIFEPRKKYFIRFLYLSFWISCLTAFDVLIEKYTDLIEYDHYAWYWTWLDFFCLFLIANIIYHWFFKDKTLFHEGKEAVK